MSGGLPFITSARSAGIWTGISFGAAMGAFWWSQGSRWYVAVVSGAVGGALFGRWTSRASYSSYARLRAATGSHDPAVQRAAIMAAWRGPLPQDPQVRRGALAVVRHQQQVAAGYGRSNVWGLVVAGCVCAVLAAVWSPWWWVDTVVSWPGAAMQAWIPHRWARRGDRLGHPDAADS